VRLKRGAALLGSNLGVRCKRTGKGLKTARKLLLGLYDVKRCLCVTAGRSCPSSLQATKKQFQKLQELAQDTQNEVRLMHVPTHSSRRDERSSLALVSCERSRTEFTSPHSTWTQNFASDAETDTPHLGCAVAFQVKPRVFRAKPSNRGEACLSASKRPQKYVRKVTGGGA